MRALALTLALWHTPPAERPRHPSLLAPAPIGSDVQLRIDDALSQAQHNLTSVLARAQHLGSAYRTWLWVTPSFGEVNGATVRFDLPRRW